MRIVKPSFEELIDDKLFTKVELCGRVCYKSEDKITETSAQAFVKRICTANHGSVLEHYNLIFKIDQEYYETLEKADLKFFVLTNYNHNYLVSFNLRAFVTYYNADNVQLLLPICNYMEANYPTLFEGNHEQSSIKIERVEDVNKLTSQEKDKHLRITIRVITDRGVTHELVRHRLASFSQESTRYCNYSKDKFGNEITVIEPQGLSKEAYEVWYDACKYAETSYFKMLATGATAQQCRSVLPNSLKTEIVITASIEEWKLIFALRTHPTAHPDCVATMLPVKNYFIEKGYIDGNF